MCGVRVEQIGIPRTQVDRCEQAVRVTLFEARLLWPFPSLALHLHAASTSSTLGPNKYKVNFIKLCAGGNQWHPFGPFDEATALATLKWLPVSSCSTLLIKIVKIKLFCLHWDHT